MLLSMTGFGEAQARDDGMAVSVEIRAVNSRFFKLSLRTSEGLTSLEPKIEAIVRQRVRRGAVQVNVRVHREHRPEDYKLNVDVLGRYRKQLDALQYDWGTAETISLGSLLLLPGVVDEAATDTADVDRQWPLIGDALERAAAGLEQMRRDEGRRMADDLRANCRAAAASLDRIHQRAPAMIEDYRSRLTERLQTSLANLDIALEPHEVVREVALYAERADISEEIVRLRSHLEQFEAIMDSGESNGRKLEFLTQEMLRETNTIGSKANDVEVAGHVIEIKTAIERIREMIQNIE